MAEHTLNFVEGEGIAVQSTLNTDETAWNVEISNTIGTLLDVKGDLLTASDLDTPARLPVGTDGQVLTADSTSETGLAWAAGGGSATSAWIPLFDSPDGTAVLDTDHTVILTHVPIA